MNRDQIIRIADDAGLTIFEGSQDRILFDGSIVDSLARFSALAAAHEREECAKVCEGKICAGDGDYTNGANMARREDAGAIRARGQAK
jgi:hypothetical protein